MDMASSMAATPILKGQPTQPTDVLLVSSLDEDRLQLAQILGTMLWRVRRVGTCHEAQMELKRTRPPVVICEVGLLDGDWTTVHECVTRLKPQPHLLVLSSRLDSLLWFEARHLGARDVLVKPFQDADVTAKVESALEDWNRRVATA